MANGQQGRGGPAPKARGGRPSASAASLLPAADPLAQAYRRGLDLHREGKLQEAGIAYQQVLSANPRHADAGHSLAMVHHQTGRPEIAERLIRRAIESVPNNPVFHSNLGLVLLALDRPAEAVEAYRKALRLDPDAAPLHAQLGVALLAMGRAGDAVQSEQRALRLRPGYGMALAHLGRALGALGRHKEAAESFAHAVAAQPGLVEAHVGWGDLLADSDPETAATHYRDAVGLRPDHAAAHMGLAHVLSRLGEHQSAADNFKATAFLKPSAPAYLGLARELLSLEIPAEARDAALMAFKLATAPADRADSEALLLSLGMAPTDLEQQRALSDLERQEAQNRIAVEATPGNAVALANLGSALLSLGRMREAVDHYRRAIALQPDYFLGWSEYLFTINYLGDLPVDEMTAEAKRYGELVAAAIPARTSHANLPDRAKRLKVGLVSADLHSHPVGRFLEAVLRDTDRRQVEFIVYHNSSIADGLTARLQQIVPNWHSVERLSDEELAARVEADGIDILVDLSGHSVRNRLPVFARKPAPVAFTWIGYFATTGLKAIDYVLSTRWVIPADEEWQWVERPWHMPETYLCFSAPNVEVPLAAPPALTNGYVTFGSANNFNKLNDVTAACWADVLRAVPDSRLLLRSRQLGDPAVTEQVRARFATLGIAADRLLLQGADTDYGRHLSRYNDVDIALDPFPYAGGTTTVESLWMGVPVLTLRGDRYVAHMGENILHNVGLENWIATDRDDYVGKAKDFASDVAVLGELRQELRRMITASPMFDAPRFARHFETALRGMWETWCAGREV